MKQWLKEICRLIELPIEVEKAVLEYEKQVAFFNAKEKLKALTTYATSEMTRLELKQQLESDEFGVKMLTWMLVGLKFTKEAYEARGIPEEVFIATMKIFSRFLNEYQMGYGFMGFTKIGGRRAKCRCNCFESGN